MEKKELKQIPDEKRQMRSGGLFSTKEKRVTPGPRYATSGNIDFAQNADYVIPNAFGATEIKFFGVAYNNTGTVRVDVFGVAQLRPSYYFQPESSTTVAVGANVKKLIQAGHWFLSTTGVSPQFRARAVELTLVNIDWPTQGDIVARMEITDYTNKNFTVQVRLAAGWAIAGNFMCT